MPVKKEFSEAETQEIIRLYKLHLSTGKVAGIFDCYPTVIRRVLHNNHIELIGASLHSKRIVNYEVMDTINPKSAYILGLFIADGSFTHNKQAHQVEFSLGLKASDRLLIEKVRDILSPGRPLIEDRHMVVLRIKDTPLSLNIVKWGIEWKEKSYRLGECSFLFDSLKNKKCLHHFVRGFFDGDGSISFPIKYPQNCSMSFCGTTSFIYRLQKEINEGASLSCKGAIGSRKDLMQNGEYLEYLAYTGPNIVTKIGNWMYKNARGLFLERKHKVYTGVIKSRELLGPPKYFDCHREGVRRKTGQSAAKSVEAKYM